MDMTGEERISAPRTAVWKALNDVQILKACIPRCDRLDWASPETLTALIKVKLGPLSASFNVDITLSNVIPGESYTISAEGKGGLAGFARGSADVVLVDEGEETVLQYKAGAEIGGRLAQIGSRIIGASAGKLAQQFFADFGAAAESAAYPGENEGLNAGGTLSSLE